MKSRICLKMEAIVLNFIEENDFESYAYSGRSMYGARCLAITLGTYELSEHSNFIKETGGTIDNMGLDFVVYWKYIPK